ncbi:MAG: DivIVA domain-containing protein [Nocardioidaceae bacterium]
MMWLFAVLIVLAMGGVALLAAGRGRPLAEEYGDRPDSLVPVDGPVQGDHLRRIRFSLAFRGYRMSEVDELLDRLARELDERTGEKPDEEPGEKTGEKPGEKSDEEPDEKSDEKPDEKTGESGPPTQDGPDGTTTAT